MTVKTTDEAQTTETTMSQTETKAEQDASQSQKRLAHSGETEQVENKKSFLEHLKEKVLGKSDETDKNESGKESETIETTEEGEEIPDKFTDAARAAGWDDEKIKEHAEKFTNEQLLEQIAQISEIIEKKEETYDGTSKEEELPDEITDTSDKDDKIVKLEERLAQLESGLTKQQEQEKKTQVVIRFTTTNEYLDKLAEKYDSFGKFDELPTLPDGRLIRTSPEFKARAEVFDTANLFAGKGMKWQEALENAVAWYAGKHLAKDTERNVIKKLKNSGKKISPGRMEKATSKKYGSDREEIQDYMENLARNSGVEI